ncbi:MAG: nucleobase:cation symporter-2 family protein [Pseudomonadota bacterium]
MSEVELSVNEVDEVLPPSRTVTLGFQHLLAAYASLVVTPLIVAGAVGWSGEQITYLISACLLASGVCTLVQCIGLGQSIGIRFPVVQGTTIAVVPVLIAIGTTSNLQAMFGATIVAGIMAFVLAGPWSRILRFFPPIVVGTVITAIGLSLFPVAVMWMSGGAGFGAQDVSVSDMGLAFFSLFVVIGVMRFGRGLLARSAILVGLLCGTLLAVVMGQVDPTPVAEAPWFGVVVPFAFGVPTFEWPAIIAMCLVMLVTMVESTGDYFAIGAVCGKQVGKQEIAQGLRAEGLGTVLGGVLNSFPFTTFSQNTGVLRISGVRSRWVVATTGVLMILVSFFPKIAAVFAMIPTPVLGGCGLVMFGSIAGTGIAMLRDSDLSDNGNLLTVCVSLGMAMLVIANPTYFAALPDDLSLVIANAITLAGVSAVGLNALFSRS